MTDVGDLIRFGNPSHDPASAPFADLDGTPTNPTAVTLVVQKPSGTQLEYGWPSSGPDGMLTNESAGRFYVAVLIDVAGTWEYRLAGTGAVTAADESTLRVQRQQVVAP